MSKTNMWVVVIAVVITGMVTYVNQESKNANAPSVADSTYGNQQSPANTSLPANNPSQSPTTGTPTPKPTTSHPITPTPTPPPKTVQSNIYFITPVAGDVWKIGTQYPISWNKEGGVSGYIYLVDAKSGSIAGVILSETGPHQTSYSWNTRDLFLTRLSPTKKTVLPGTYVTKLYFDGNIPTITSPSFIISQ